MNLPEPIGEAALAFFQKLLGPVAEATAILSDKIRFYRWKSSLKTLQRAREIARERHIKINEVPLKFLIPFMEKSSLEEEDSPLVEKWAALLAQAAADPNSVQASFVEILARLSPEDVQALEQLVTQDLIDDANDEPGDMAFERRINISLVVRETSHYSFFKKGLEDLTRDRDKISYREDLSNHCSSAMNNKRIFCENIQILFEPFEKDDIFRHSMRLPKLSSMDVLTSLGLALRRTFVFTGHNYSGMLTLVSPTVLGVQFVMACRGPGSDEKGL